MPKVKPIEKILDIDSYRNDRKVIFRIVGPDQQPRDANDSVEVPISIVYRLFHLGRAYDFQTIKLIQPGGMTRIDYLHLPLLTLEFEQIFHLVNDPVARHYLQTLLPLLKSKRHDTKTALVVVTQ
jgi:hypothetical protein